MCLSTLGMCTYASFKSECKLHHRKFMLRLNDHYVCRLVGKHSGA